MNTFNPNRTIPAGYQLRVQSWENDGDHYHIKTLSGLTREDIAFYVELACLFGTNYDKQYAGFGNQSVSVEKLAVAVREVASRHPNVSEHYKQWLTRDPRCLHRDLRATILGETHDYYDDEEFCRAVDDIRVFFFPEDIQEVTEQFFNNQGV